MRPGIRRGGEFRPAQIDIEPTESSKEKLVRCLSQHVVDVQPNWSGSEKHRSGFGSNPVAALESSVGRCEPSLQVPKLALEQGKSIVLVGPNGAGKSTLLDAIMERRNASFDSGSSGYSKGVHGKETLRISRLDQEELLGEIANLSAQEVIDLTVEHFKSQFPVEWEDPEAYEQNMINQDAELRIESLVDQAKTLFEADVFMDRKVSELSGGERTKLSLLMVLASEPDVLLLDEPTNHLDLESIAKLTGLFDTYKRAGVSVVNVSHVEWFLDMVGEDGTIELSANQNKRETTQSNSPYRKFKKRERRPAAIRDSIDWQKDNGKVFIGGLFQTAREVTIPDSPLSNVTIPSFQGGEISVLAGKNGTGKTKLMNELADKKSRYIERAEKGIQTAYLPQLWPQEVMDGTVKNFFQWIKDQINPHSTIAPSRLQKELRRLGLGDGRANPLQETFSTFSGGEQRLLWFATASLLEGTDVLILDEPSNHMDEPTMEKVVEAIQKFPGAVILSTHDLRLMAALEKDPGPTRQGRGVTNIVFDRDPDGVTISQSDTSPLEHAQTTIANSRKRAKRIKV